MIKRKNKGFNKKSSTYFFARYSGMAFEMLGIIVLGVFAGKKIDEKTSSEFPLWTLILSLLAVFVSLYLVIKGLVKK